MSKYVIKNCKSLISNGICELYSQKGIHLSAYCYCKDKYCLLKKIVEKCQRTKIMCKGMESEFTLGKLTYADFILSDLDIEECE